MRGTMVAAEEWSVQREVEEPSKKEEEEKRRRKVRVGKKGGLKET